MSKKKTIIYNADEEMANALEEMSEKTGIKKSELNRRAMKKYLEEDCNEPSVMMNLVILEQYIKEAQGELSEVCFEQMQQCIRNIMVIKGGSSNGNL